MDVMYIEAGLTLIVVFLLTVVLARFIIPILKSHKAGVRILEIGPRWHKGKEGTPGVRELSTVACYAEALKRANEERTGLWIVTHLSRYFAEKREAKNLQKYLAESTSATREGGKPTLEEVNALASDYSIIRQNRRSVKAVRDVEIEKHEEEVEKERVRVVEARLEEENKRKEKRLKENRTTYHLYISNPEMPIIEEKPNGEKVYHYGDQKPSGPKNML